MNRLRGKVAHFDNQKGFGFIRPEKGDQDVFVHCSDVIVDGDHPYQTLEPGQAVEFELGSHHQRVKAVNVRAVAAT